jgi:hypothetical protein
MSHVEALTSALPVEAGSDTNHLFCCDPNKSLCGLDISNHPYIGDDADITCVVCADLLDDDTPCGPLCDIETWA